MKEEILNGLKRLIQDETSNIRAAFCRVLTDNGNGTFDLEPLSGDPIIYDVRTFESSVGFIKPVVDSIVSVQFYDNQNAYISNIIDYEEYTLLTEKRTTLASKDDLNFIGQKILLYSSSEEIDEERLDIVRNNNRNDGAIFVVADNNINITSDETIRMNSVNDFNISSESNILLGSNKEVDIIGLNKITLFSNKGVDIASSKKISLASPEITWNNIEMILLFKQLGFLLTLFDTKLQAIAPDPAQATLVQSIKDKIDRL